MSGGGFKPPEPVWLLPGRENGRAPESDSGGVFWLGLLLIVLVALAAAIVVPSALSGPETNPPASNAVSGTPTAKATPAAAPLGTCFNPRYTVAGALVRGSGKRVRCDSAKATYRRVDGGPDNSLCTSSKHRFYQRIQPVAGDTDACLRRLFKAGQCSPITTLDFEESTRMATNAVVPCDGATTSQYPAIARVWKVASDPDVCLGWFWPTDSKKRTACVRLMK